MLISVAEATEIVLAHPFRPAVERVLFTQAAGRVLAENLLADRDFPPFDRATMDGIALRSADFEAGQRQFRVAGMQAAGQPPHVFSEKNSCFEVMTGAVVPAGTDAVVRYEDLELAGNLAKVVLEKIAAGQNIHRQGSDRKTGAVLVAAGTRIGPAEIGLAATVGAVELPVFSLPRVVVISTGDELVDVAAEPLPHQIRRSNVFMVEAALRAEGLSPTLLHLPDDEAVTLEVLGELLGTVDAILLSGGVSEGKFDFVAKALETLGCARLFHGVRQRPGKPFWFGVWGNQKSKIPSVVFGFPGNPVSTFVGVLRYFLPWLRASFGLPPLPETRAALASDFTFKPALQYFLTVKTRVSPSGQRLAEPVPGHGSGDLANLADADGFLELPGVERDFFPKGEVFPFYSFR